MVKIDVSTVVNAPIRRVWAVLRDFNGHDKWHPAVAESHVEDDLPSDAVGCVRNFRLEDGAELRELLLTLSDRDHSFSYCLLDTPIPLLNYVAHTQLKPITDGDRTLWRWWSSFTTPEGREQELKKMVQDNIYAAGFRAVKRIVEA
jgi:hypothetical protein